MQRWSRGSPLRLLMQPGGVLFITAWGKILLTAANLLPGY
jgi:hypothetical protein